MLYVILDGDLTVIVQPFCSLEFYTRTDGYFRTACCTLRFLCDPCRRRKANFCKSYHLVGKTMWASIIRGKLFRLPWLTDKIAEYSAYDVELLMRRLYARTFNLSCDPGYERWNNHLESKSIINSSTSYDRRVNYWTKLIFAIVERESKNHTSSSFDGLNVENFNYINQPRNVLLDIFKYRCIGDQIIAVRVG